MLDITKKLKKYKIKVIELSERLGISRATMYRFIEYYNNGNFELIDDVTLKTLKFVDSGKATDKLEIIVFIYTLKRDLIANDSNKNLLLDIENYIYSYPDSKKTLFLKMLFKTIKFDKAIDFIMYLSIFMDDEGNVILGNLMDCKPITSYIEFLEVEKRRPSVEQELNKKKR